ADDVDVDARKLLECRGEIAERQTLGFEQHQQLLGREIRRLGLDDLRRREDDITWRKNEFTAISLKNVHFLLSPRIYSAVHILVSFGKVVRLQCPQILQRLRLPIDHDKVDHLQGSEVQ